jgi:hypothetical protein
MWSMFHWTLIKIVSWLTSSDTYFTYIQDEFIDWLIVIWLTSSDTYFTYIQEEFIDWLIVSWLTSSDTYFTYIKLVLNVREVCVTGR